MSSVCGAAPTAPRARAGEGLGGLLVFTPLFGLAIVATLSSGAAWADDLPFSPSATEACLADAASLGAREECAGASAEACFSAEGVYSNFAIGVCFGAEADYWDDRLNVAYRALMAAETEALEEMREIGARVPDTAAALREMQRAWIPYRDAACWYEYTTWGGGSGGGPANAECLMHVTAEQALKLEALLERRAR